jgi:hypothetical protein
MMKEVNKEKFEDFLSKYPGEFFTDVKYFCTPPIRMYYDAAKAKLHGAENSVLASVVLGDGMYNIVGDNYYIDEGDK